MKTEQTLKQLQDTETIILETGERISISHDADLYLDLKYLKTENYNLILNQFNDNKKIKIMTNSVYLLPIELIINNDQMELISKNTISNSLFFMRK